MSASQELVGRDAVLAQLAAFIRAVPDGPAVLILEGEPGIGKTALWTSALAEAGDAVLVLRCQGAQREADLSLLGLSDLLSPVIDTVLPVLAAPLARTLEIALLRAEAGDEPLDRRTLMTAFAHAVRSLATRGPLLIAVDDLQWLDAASAEMLAFTLRRLERGPVGVLASVRTADGEPDGYPLADAVPGLITRLPIGPLPAGPLTRILRSRVSAEIAWPVARRIHEASRGNPMHAIELGRALAPREYSIDGPLRVSPSLQQLVRRRLAALPQTTRDTLLLAAATSQPVLSSLARGLAPQSADDAIEPAVEAGLVIVNGDAISFVHPLWAAAAYSSASPGRRRRAHARLAAVAVNQEERARHLALAASAPDEDVAAALAAAAKSAAARGASGAAAELASLAARLSPDQGARLGRSIEAARYLYQAGDTAQARRSLEQLTGRLPHGTARARALLALGQVRVFDLDAGPVLGILGEALADAVGDQVLQAEIHMVMSWICEADLAAGLAHAREAERLLAEHDEPALLASICNAQLMFENLTGGGLPRDLANRALALERRAPPASVTERPSFVISSIHITHDRLDDARRGLLGTLEDIAEDEPAAARLEVLSGLVHIELLAGNWDLARHWAAETTASVELTGQEDQRCWSMALEAEVDAVQGRNADARAKAGESLRQSAAAGSPFGMLRVLPILGFVALSEDNPAEAARYLEQADEWCELIGLREPGRFRFHGDHAEALIAIGDLDRAAEVIGRLESRGRQLGRRSALASSARCAALLATARCDSGQADRELQSAFAWHDGLPMPFELGRSHLAAGEIYRRAKRKKLASEHLHAALDIFDQLGAPLWSHRASTGLARIGLRAVSSFDLTETEQQVADLVASGLTNREVAARMFVSLRTVESCLSRTYRKLGLRSRAELVRDYAARARQS